MGGIFMFLVDDPQNDSVLQKRKNRGSLPSGLKKHCLARNEFTAETKHLAWRCAEFLTVQSL